MALRIDWGSAYEARRGWTYSILLSGRLDEATVPLLREQLRHVRPDERLSISLYNLEEIDEAGVAALTEVKDERGPMLTIKTGRAKPRRAESLDVLSTRP